MEITTLKPGYSQATDGPGDEEDIADAWDQCDEEEEIRFGFDREIESLEDTYRDLREEFAMASESLEPSPVSSFGDYVAQEAAKAKADAAPPPEPEEAEPAEEAEPESATGVESAAPDPVEMIKEAMRTATGTEGTRRKESRKLNYRCKGYKTNDALANCRHINDKVRATLAIINGLMSDKGFCYCSDEQLAIWMHMSARGAKNLLNSLARRGFLIHLGSSGSNIKRVVRPDLANNPVRTQSLIDEFANIK